jgi:hypothetical protein
VPTKNGTSRKGARKVIGPDRRKRASKAATSDRCAGTIETREDAAAPADSRQPYIYQDDDPRRLYLEQLARLAPDDRDRANPTRYGLRINSAVARRLDPMVSGPGRDGELSLVVHAIEEVVRTDNDVAFRALVNWAKAQNGVIGSFSDAFGRDGQSNAAKRIRDGAARLAGFEDRTFRGQTRGRQIIERLWPLLDRTCSRSGWQMRLQRPDPESHRGHGAREDDGFDSYMTEWWAPAIDAVDGYLGSVRMVDPDKLFVVLMTAIFVMDRTTARNLLNAENASAYRKGGKARKGRLTKPDR